MATVSSCERKQGSPSFFKVVKDPSAPHLSLPSAFVRRHLEKIPKNPILKTATGEHSWRLTIRKIDGNYCFAHGWEKLVKDALLCSTDFLVFWLIDSFTFQVSIFDAHGCEKDLPSNNTSEGEGDDGGCCGGSGVGDDGGGDDEEVIPDENLCFQKVISEKTHKYTMALPRKFVETAGIGNRSGLTIKDLEGKEWIVGLVAERYRSTKYTLSSGWSLFREYHELLDGDICLFKFIKKEGVLTLAQVIKSKRERKQESQHKKTREVEVGKRKSGRPRLEKPHGGGDVKIEDESSPEVAVMKRKRGRPPLEKPRGGGGVDVKIEDELSPKVEVVKRKRGRPPLEKPCRGGVDVKIEDESGPKVEVVKRKRERPPLEKPRRRGGDVDVKIEYESGPEVEVAKRKKGRPPLEKPGGGDRRRVHVKIEDESCPEVEVVKKKRGRPPLGKRDGDGGVVVKVEDESRSDEEVEVMKRKWGRPPLGKPCDGGGGSSVEVKIEDELAPEVDAVKRKRGRQLLERFVRSNRVIYF